MNTDKWIPVFLATYRDTGSIRFAAGKANVSTGRIYRRKATSLEFARDMSAARGVYADSLEKEARRRAKRGSKILSAFLGKAA